MDAGDRLVWKIAREEGGRKEWCTQVLKYGQWEKQEVWLHFGTNASEAVPFKSEKSAWWHVYRYREQVPGDKGRYKVEVMKNAASPKKE